MWIVTWLSFGVHSASKLFNILADILHWIAQQHGVYHIMFFVEDFLLLGLLDLMNVKAHCL